VARAAWTRLLAPFGGSTGDGRLLPRLRVALAAAGVVALAAGVVQCLTGTGPLWHLLGVPALAALGWRAWRTRSAQPAWWQAVEAALVGIVVAVLGAGPAAAVLVTMAAWWAATAPRRTLVSGGAMTALAVVAAPVVAGQGIGNGSLGAVLPGLVVSAVAVHLLASSLERYEDSALVRFESLVVAASDVILVADEQLRLTYCTPSISTVLGRSADGAIGSTILDWVPADDRSRVAVGLATVGADPSTVECDLVRGDGSAISCEITARNQLDDPRVGGLVLTIRNVTERVTEAHQLEHRAFHDPLTNLANRALFTERLEVAMQSDVPRSAVLLLDLDGFKQVNDTFGHEAGDQLLRAVADRVRPCVSAADTVSRLGGDEFAVLLVDANGTEAGALEVAFRIMTALAAPIALAPSTSGVEEPLIQGSIGIAVAAPGMDSTTLLRNADVAMYRAKRGGKNRVEVFHSEMARESRRRLAAERELRDAADAEPWVAQYQPIVDLGTGEILAVEALVRWNHPERGLVGPADFLPIAEEIGLAAQIGDWMLREACNRVAGWQHDGFSALVANINVSAQQFEDGTFVGRVRDVLDSSRLVHRSLIIDVPPALLMEGDDAVVEQLTELKRLGVRIAVDDFGVHPTTLADLQRFPVDALKIDRSFVTRLGWPDPAAPALARTVLAMGIALGLDVVAEGIETSEQRAQLVALGCSLGQGYSIARPLNAPVVEQVLRSRFAGAAGVASSPSAGVRPAG
jgi:diguanylate cyclase (GGDEF)-like protein/PAS domain S-box-containing protein